MQISINVWLLVVWVVLFAYGIGIITGLWLKERTESASRRF